MGDWRPDETLIIPSTEKPYGTARENRVMLWVIPAPVAGEWRLSTPDVRFTLTQRLQDVTATASQSKGVVGQLAGHRARDRVAGRQQAQRCFAVKCRASVAGAGAASGR